MLYHVEFAHLACLAGQSSCSLHFNKPIQHESVKLNFVHLQVENVSWRAKNSHVRSLASGD